VVLIPHFCHNIIFGHLIVDEYNIPNSSHFLVWYSDSSIHE